MKISLIGVGRVGSTAGVVLAARHLVDEIVLVGRSRERAEAEALDLRHATAFGRPTRVYAGDCADTAGSDVLVLALNAAARAPAGGRDAGAAANAAALSEIVPALAAASPAAVLVVATNPVDAMTAVVARLSGFAPARVLGTGTLLDTMRLRSALSERLGVHPQDIRAYVLGEHGDGQFVAFGSASVGGGPLGLTPDEARAVEADVRAAGHHIVRTKGYTNSGIALAIAEIVETVVRDLHQVVPVSTPLDGYCGQAGVCLSVPVVLGRAGVLRTIPIALTSQETQAFARSAASVRATMAALGLGTSDSSMPDRTTEGGPTSA